MKRCLGFSVTAALVLLLIGFLAGWQASPRSPGGILPRTTDEWSASAAWAGVVLAVVAAWYARRQLDEARDLRLEEAQAVVTCHLDLSWTGSKNPIAVVSLVIKNVGPTPARRVTIKWSEPPMRATNALHPPNWEAAPLDVPSAFPSLAQGQEWRTVWGAVEHRLKVPELATQDSYKVKIEWDGVEGTDRQSLETNLDWAPYRYVHTLTTGE